MVILPKSESSDLVGIVIKEKEMKNKKKIKKKELKPVKTYIRRKRKTQVLRNN